MFRRKKMPYTMHDRAIRTREILLDQGWTQGSWVTSRGGKRGRVCLLGAYRLACGNNALVPHPTEGTFAIALGFWNSGDAIYWNDTRGRRLKDIIARLDNYIEHGEQWPATNAAMSSFFASLVEVETWQPSTSASELEEPKELVCA